MGSLVAPHMGYGVRRDVEEHLAPFGSLRDLQNFRVLKGAVEKLPGYEKYYTGVGAIAGIPTGLTSFPLVVINPKLIMVTTTKAYHLPDRNTLTDITGATSLTGTRDNLPYFAYWPSKILITNYVDPIKIWDGIAASVSDVAGSPPKAKIIHTWFNHVFAFNLKEGVTERPVGVRWCKLGNFEVWAGDPSAGNYDIDDAATPISAAYPIGPYMFIFLNDAIHRMRYEGDPIWVSRVPLTKELGCVGSLAVNTDGRRLFWISDGNFHASDGSSIEDIGNAVKDLIFPNVSRAYLSRSIVYHDRDNRQMVFCVPSSPSAEPDTHIAFNLVEGNWGDVRKLAISAVDIHPDPVSGKPLKLATVAAPSALHILDSTDGADGAAWDGWVQTCFSTLQSTEDPAIRYKIVSELELFAAIRAGVPNFNVSMEVHYKDNIDATATIFGPININTSNIGRMIIGGFNVKAKFFSFKFRSPGKDQPIKFTGFRVNRTMGGFI